MPDTALQQRIRDNSLPLDSGCWLWLKSARWPGYGAIRCGSKIVDAHRASYLAFTGDIPAGLVVRHTCDNRWCTNPEHLVIGTVGDNTRDAITRSGFKPFRKLHAVTARTETKIRKQFAAGRKSKRQLSRENGIPMRSLGRLLAKSV